MREYNPSDPLSIFRYSSRLIRRSLADVLPEIDPAVNINDLDQKGKGGLGMLVERHFFGYEPNSNPEADFEEAGVELKVSPLKRTSKGELAIKERLVCDMIDYMSIVTEEFEDSRFYRKSMLMLILFYLHVSGHPRKNLRFLYSVLWGLKDKDLLIIRNDFLTIRDKVRSGKAHELSEGDTLYLGACRKGQKGQPPRRQPFSDTPAFARAFSLKPAYMRSILDFVRNKESGMASNLSDKEIPGIELVTASELKKLSFEEILKNRFEPFIGMDCQMIAEKLGTEYNPTEKSQNATAVRNILSRSLKKAEDAEELKKAGIKVKTIRIQKNGMVREHMSFQNIDFREVLETEEWTDSQWYDIITTRYMFVIFREDTDSEESRYVLDRMFFWTMPTSDYPAARDYWENIRSNVFNDTLLDDNNTFWRIKDHRYFHVRPKAKNSSDTTTSPVSGKAVPKKAYWFDNRYLMKEIRTAYGTDWDKTFKTI